MTGPGGCLGVVSPRRCRVGTYELVVPQPATPPPLFAYQLSLFGRRPRLNTPPQAMPGDVGVTYLLCFRDQVGEHERYVHAGHYLGWALDLPHRLREHRAGAGGRLVQVIQEAGLTWTVARIWPGTTRVWEASLKRRGGRARLCPLCDPAGAARRALDPFRIPGAGPNLLGLGPAARGGGRVTSTACELLIHDPRRVGKFLAWKNDRADWDDCWRPCGRGADDTVAVDAGNRQVCSPCRRQLEALTQLGMADKVRWIEPGWQAPKKAKP